MDSGGLVGLFMIQADYNPMEMIRVMEILKAAGGTNRVPKLQSIHPDPENRIENIKEVIAKHKGQN